MRSVYEMPMMGAGLDPDTGLVRMRLEGHEELELPDVDALMCSDGAFALGVQLIAASVACSMYDPEEVKAWMARYAKVVLP